MQKNIVLSMILLASLNAQAETKQEMVQQSRKAIKQFSTQLKQQLQHGLQQGGAVAAIKICHTSAAVIAEELSEQLGWKVSRTSLKVRNSRHIPDDWEESVLHSFEDRHQKGESIESLEFSDTIEANGKQTFRYMKAIPTGKLCLNCHGSSLTTDVKQQLQQFYPNDKAVGFKVGDIRGAFSISREMD